MKSLKEIEDLKMEDKRLWCYGLNKNGKFYGNEIHPLEEKWEAIEKGEELAKYERLESFYIGRVDKENNVEDIEEIRLDTSIVTEKINVSDLNKKADELGFYSSRRSHSLKKG